MARTITELPADLAERIRDLRKTRDLSQEALAGRMQALGLTGWRQTTVAKAEAKERPRALTAQEVVALAAAFDLGSVTELFPESIESSLADRAVGIHVGQLERLRERLEGLAPSASPEHRRSVDEQVARLGAILGETSEIVTDRALDRRMVLAELLDELGRLPGPGAEEPR